MMTSGLIATTGVENGAGCLLFVRDGVLSSLEGYTYVGEEWPGTPGRPGAAAPTRAFRQSARWATLGRWRIEGKSAEQRSSGRTGLSRSRRSRHEMQSRRLLYGRISVRSSSRNRSRQAQRPTERSPHPDHRGRSRAARDFPVRHSARADHAATLSAAWRSTVLSLRARFAKRMVPLAHERYLVDHALSILGPRRPLLLTLRVGRDG